MEIISENGDLEKKEIKEFRGRQTAVKVWIKDIVNGSYVIKKGYEPNYILAANKIKVSRANIIGVVVGKSSTDILNYSYLVIDDGSDKITARAFDNRDLLLDFNIGDMVNIIGRPREYGKEIYIAPEIVKKILDKKWVEIRKIELMGQERYLLSREAEKAAGNRDDEESSEKIQEEIIVDDIIPNKAEKIISAIRQNDSGDGMEINDLIQKAGLDGDSKIKELLMQGDIFEVKPGKVKVLE